jgi:hypothetical protein
MKCGRRHVEATLDKKKKTGRKKGDKKVCLKGKIKGRKKLRERKENMDGRM